MKRISNLILLIIIINVSYIASDHSKTTQKIRLRELEWEEIISSLQGYNETENKCMESFKNYKEGLSTSQEWALFMLDSSSKTPDGILKGNTYSLGNFDECIGAANENFTGQYCLADTAIQIPAELKKKYSAFIFPHRNPMLSQVGENLVLNLHYGVCVPSTCTAENLTTLINNMLSTSGKSSSIKKISFKESNCNTGKPKIFSTGFWVVIAFIIVVIIIALASTSYEIYCIKNQNKAHALLTAFSLHRNGKFLFKVTSEDGQTLSCLHGLRSLSLAWIVLGHAAAMNVPAPKINSMDILDMVHDINHIFVSSTAVAVDSFFLLSGLLVCFVFYRDIGKKGGYDVLLGYIHRYLRLTPLFAFMIVIVVTTFEYMGNGPLWNQHTIPFLNSCKSTWHWGLLYVQNYVSPHQACFGTTWYLSADMQLFWVAPLLLYPTLLLPPRTAGGFILVVILIWTCVTTGLEYVYKGAPSLLIRLNPWAGEYVFAHTRAGPWLVGIALGFLIVGIKDNRVRIRLSKVQVALGWICSTALCLGVCYGLIPFLDLQPTQSQAATTFMVLHRLGWSLGLSWIIFACVTGYGGLVNTFLSWGIFQILGKLSYCVFLIHTTVQVFRLGRLRTNVYMGEVDTVYSFLGDYMISNLLSIPLVLLFEIPIANLDRYFFSNVEIFRYPRRKSDLILTTKNENSSKCISNEGCEAKRPNLNMKSMCYMLFRPE